MSGADPLSFGTAATQDVQPASTWDTGYDPIPQAGASEFHYYRAAVGDISDWDPTAQASTLRQSYHQAAASQPEFGQPSAPPMADFMVHSANPAKISITVHSPTKARSWSGIPGIYDSYTEYHITAHDAATGDVRTVRRRFRDVVALQDLLKAQYPGVITPPRPARNAVAAKLADPTFVESRRGAIERHLNRLARHATLQSSEPLKLFLTLESDLVHSPAWQLLHPRHVSFASSAMRLVRVMTGAERGVPSPEAASRSASATGDLARGMRESIAQLRGVTKGVEISPMESRLRDTGVMLEERRRALVAFERAAAGVAGKLGDMKHALTDFSAAMRGLALFQADATTRSEAHVATASEAAAGAAAAATTASALLASTMGELSRFVPAAQAAMHCRERALVTSLTLDRDLRARREVMTNQEYTPGAGAKLAVTREEVHSLEVAHAAAQAEYVRLAEVNEAEVAHMSGEVSSATLAALLAWAVVQADASHKTAVAWEQVKQGLAN